MGRLSKILLFFLGSILWITQIFAQLDTVHFLPPCHARYDHGRHYVYLSTPEQVAFPVYIVKGDGTPFIDGNGTFLTSVMISNNAPQIIYLGNGANPLNGIVTLTDPSELNTPISHKGLMFHAEKPFYANFRARTTDQAGSLTCKGRSALGTSFRTGHVFNQSVPNIAWPRRSNFVGLMASEDDTQITISEYAAGITLMSGGGDFSPPPVITVTLNRGQSYIISTYVEFNRPQQNNNGLQGALITATKPIAVNTGSWLGSPFTDPVQDIGIDQIVPIDHVGEEYITVRGDGPVGLEVPVVVATEDNTSVYLQGNTIPAATIQKGQFFKVPDGSYSVNENLYIKATQPVYVYQTMGGANFPQTGGMNFVPPLKCAEGGKVDNIVDINKIGNTSYNGKLILIAEKGKPVWINSVQIPVSQLKNVSGNNDYVTFKSGGLSGNIKVESTGALQVGMFGRNDNAGWAGYFSGFDDPPIPRLNITTSKTCVDTIFVKELTNVDSLYWYYEGNLMPGIHDTLLAHPQPGNYQVIARRDFCNTILWDTSEIIFVPIPLTVDVSIDTITCPGGQTGGFDIRILQGGAAPYQISYDGGMTFDVLFSASGLDTGVVQYIILDSLGCTYIDAFHIPLVPDLPIIDLGNPDTLNCITQSIQIDIGQSTSGPGYEWTWSSADGHPIINPSEPAVTLNLPGTYHLTILKIANQCKVDTFITIPIDTISPEIQLNGPNTITCRDTTISINAVAHQGNQYIYEWQMNPGLTVSDSTVSTVIIKNSGIYFVTVTDQNNGCTKLENIEIGIDTIAPTLLLSSPDTINCLKDYVTLSLNGQLSSEFLYIWTNNVNDTLTTGSSHAWTVHQGGEYKAIIFNILNGCYQEINTNVLSFLNQPATVIQIPKAITCNNPSSTLIATTENCQHCIGEWVSLQGKEFSKTTSSAIETSQAGAYAYLVVDTLSRCQAGDTAYVISIPPPESFDIVTENPDCISVNGSIIISNVQGGQPPYVYSFNNGTTFGSDPYFLTANPATYTVMIKDANGCQLNSTVTIEDIILPSIELLPLIEIQWGESITLNPLLNVPASTIVSYLWTPSESLSCHTCQSTIADPLQNTTYTLTVVDTNGCTATATIRINVIFDAAIYIPNAFSPDHNGLNDGFTAYGDPAKIEQINFLRIYDRWGNAIFEKEVLPINDTSFGWDGNYRGKKMDPAIFVYVIKVLFKNGETAVFKGDVNLVR